MIEHIKKLFGFGRKETAADFLFKPGQSIAPQDPAADAGTPGHSRLTIYGYTGEGKYIAGSVTGLKSYPKLATEKSFALAPGSGPAWNNAALAVFKYQMGTTLFNRPLHEPWIVRGFRLSPERTDYILQSPSLHACIELPRQDVEKHYALNFPTQHAHQPGK